MITVPFAVEDGEWNSFFSLKYCLSIFVQRLSARGFIVLYLKNTFSELLSYGEITRLNANNCNYCQKFLAVSFFFSIFASSKRWFLGILNYVPLSRLKQGSYKPLLIVRLLTDLLITFYDEKTFPYILYSFWSSWCSCSRGCGFRI